MTHTAEGLGAASPPEQRRPNDLIEDQVETQTDTPYFVEEAQRAAKEYGAAVGSLEHLGLSNVDFTQVVDFIEKSRAYSAKAFADQESAQARTEERELKFNRNKSEDEAKAAERQLQLEKEAQTEKRVIFEARLRGILALILVLGTLAGVLFGLSGAIAPKALTQYLAPITGLAGITLGYFFGRESKV